MAFFILLIKAPRTLACPGRRLMVNGVVSSVAYFLLLPYENTGLTGFLLYHFSGIFLHNYMQSV
jgi:hypothetical protein